MGIKGPTQNQHNGTKSHGLKPYHCHRIAESKNLSKSQSDPSIYGEGHQVTRMVYTPWGVMINMIIKGYIITHL